MDPRPQPGNQLPAELLNRIHICSLEQAQAVLVPLMWPIFAGLLLIATVWLGVQTMFRGSVDWIAVVGWLFSAGIASGMLTIYYSPTPVATPFGNVQGIAHTITQGGIFIASTIYAQAGQMFYTSYQRTQGRVLGRLHGTAATTAATEDGSGSSISSIFRRFSDIMLFGAIRIMEYLFMFLLWCIYWLCQAQYLWAYAAIAVLSLLGPVFIPFILFPQTDWLFWGWAKGLFQCAIHMITAAAMFAFVSILTVMPLNRLADIPAPGDPGSLTGLLDYGASFIEFVPTLVISILGTMAIGQMAGQLTSGAAPPAAGLMHRAGQAIAGAASAVSPFQGVGGTAGTQGMQTLSSGTAPGAHPSQPAQAAAAVLAARRGTSAGGGRGSGAGAGPGAGPGTKTPVLASTLAAGQGRRNMDSALADLQKQFNRGELTSDGFRRFSDVMAQTMGKMDSAAKLDTQRVRRVMSEVPSTRADRLHDRAQGLAAGQRAARGGPGPQPT